MHLPLPGGATNIAYAAGWSIGAAGVTVALFALGLFGRAGQDPHPWKTTPALIETGVYRWTRNPMYLGMALVITAFALVLNSLWFLIGTIAFMLSVYQLAVRPEEHYLTNKFGDDYAAYCARVRRWL